MIQSVRAAMRAILRGEVFTVLNFVGLTIGLASFGVISAWVLNELSYDRFYPNHDRIVRVISNVKTGSDTFDQAVTSLPLAATLKEDFPEIEQTVRLDDHNCIVRRGDTQFEERGVLYADNSFFSVFSTELLQGDVRTALSAPYSIVLTKSIAEKYFSNQNPVGESLTMFQYDPDGLGAHYTVTGVVKDPPLNSHFRYSILASFATVEAVRPEALTSPWRFMNNRYYTYLLLRHADDRKAVQEKLPAFNERYLGETSGELKMSYTFKLQPIADIHLNSHARYEIHSTGNMESVLVFGTIGFSILFIACINYTNIASARAIGRAKEIGVKKILGATKRVLILQVLIESLLMAVMSLLAAIVLVEAGTTFLSSLTDGAVQTVVSLESIGVMITAALISGLFSGLYPALLLSAFSPLTIVQSQKSSVIGSLTRKGLVVLQFSVSIVLLAGIAVVSSQMSYIRSMDLGYNKNALLILDQNGFNSVNRGYDAFRDDLLSDASIAGVTTSRGLILGGLSNRYVATVDGQGQPVTSSVYTLIVGEDFLDVYGMKLLAGRRLTVTDSGHAFIVNESAVRQFGWASPQVAIGKPFRTGDEVSSVVGVVKDFNFTSLRNPIEPLALLREAPNVFSRIAVRIQSSDMMAARAFVEKTWKKHFPSALLSDSFLDERLERQYQSELLFERMFGIFVSLSILVACLGLFGLSSFAIGRRIKEIGIRRVLGASVPRLVGTLAREFMTLVGAAVVFAIPVAWIILSDWLGSFSYRIELGPAPFIFAGVVAMGVAFFIVGAEALRAARRNPVESLRYE